MQLNREACHKLSEFIVFDICRVCSPRFTSFCAEQKRESGTCWCMHACASQSHTFLFCLFASLRVRPWFFVAKGKEGQQLLLRRLLDALGGTVPECATNFVEMIQVSPKRYGRTSPSPLAAARRRNRRHELFLCCSHSCMRPGVVKLEPRLSIAGFSAE